MSLQHDLCRMKHRLVTYKDKKEKVWVLRLPVLQCILDCMFKQLNLYVLAITIYRFQCDIQYKAVFPSARAPYSASAHMGSGECSLSHTTIWHSSPHPLCSTPCLCCWSVDFLSGFISTHSSYLSGPSQAHCGAFLCVLYPRKFISEFFRLCGSAFYIGV